MDISFREKRRICLNIADASFPRNPAPVFKIRNERKIQMSFYLLYGHIVHNFPTFMTYALGIEREREKRVYTESGGERKSPYDSSFLSFRGSGGGGEREERRGKGAVPESEPEGKDRLFRYSGFYHLINRIYIHYIHGGGGETVFPDLRRCVS